MSLGKKLFGKNGGVNILLLFDCLVLLTVFNKKGRVVGLVDMDWFWAWYLRLDQAL